MGLRILLVRFSSIGDLLLTTPLVRALRARHPDAQITFVTRDDMAATLRGNPRIDEVIAWPRGGSLRRLADQLASPPWTHRLDLHGSVRSSALRALMGGHWSGYSKQRIRRKLLILSHRRDAVPLRHIAERYFDAARDLDVAPDGGPPEFFVGAAARAAADDLLSERRLGIDRPLIALVPGAAHFTKRWPVRHWSALASAITSDHDLVILGGSAERDAARAISAATGERAVNVAGRFDLEGTAALLARCDRAIAGDTGVLHLATAVGTPVIGLYGPTVEAFGFFPYRSRYIAVQHDLACRPCSSQGGPACPLGHHHCLALLLPDEVIAAVNA